MADIFREVDEDLRRDNFAQLWKKYGVCVIGIAALLVVATALFVGWREWRLAESRDFSARLVAAGELADAGNTEQAVSAYESLSSDAGGGFETLARLKEAALAARAGQREQAVAAYEALASDADAKRVYRDLASLLLVLHQMDAGDPEGLIGRLEPLTADGNAWRYSARELTALLERRRGNEDKAIELYTAIEQASDAPPDMRTRAREMLSVMGAANVG